MAIKFGVIMDPIESIKIHKDTTFAVLLEAQKQGFELYYMQQKDLYLRDGLVQAHMQTLNVQDDNNKWFELGETERLSVSDLDVIFMRKDPPFNMEYIYTTYLLELAEKAGVLVVNNPQSLRDANEKLFTAWFPECCPSTLVSSNMQLLKEFLLEQKDIILKPLDGMGGRAIFRVQENDPNLNVIFETLTDHGQNNIMAQRYIPEILQGDKRIILIDGEPVPYALARIPAAGETRANLATGGKGVAQPLTDRDRWICKQVGDTLRKKGLMLVGLDVIGDYLTEINVTSPTCIREIDAAFDTNIAAKLIECIRNYL